MGFVQLNVLAVLTVLVLCGYASDAEAQSLDCSKPITLAERTICADADLVRLENERAGVAGNVGRETFAEARDLCGSSTDCLRATYLNELQRLRLEPTQAIEEATDSVEGDAPNLPLPLEPSEVTPPASTSTTEEAAVPHQDAAPPTILERLGFAALFALAAVLSALPLIPRFGQDRTEITQGFLFSLVSIAIFLVTAIYFASAAVSAISGLSLAALSWGSPWVFFAMLLIGGVLRSISAGVVIDGASGMLEIPTWFGVRKIPLASVRSLRSDIQYMGGNNWSATTHKVQIEHDGGHPTLQFPSSQRLEKFIRAVSERAPHVYRY